MGELAAQGRGVLFVSSYLPELLGVCDRLAVMARGRLSEARPVADWTPEQIMAYATGAQMELKTPIEKPETPAVRQWPLAVSAVAFAGSAGHPRLICVLAGSRKSASQFPEPRQPASACCTRPASRLWWRLGMLLIIVSGGIDLSVGMVLGLATVGMMLVYNATLESTASVALGQPGGGTDRDRRRRLVRSGQWAVGDAIARVAIRDHAGHVRRGLWSGGVVGTRDRWLSRGTDPTG